MSLVGAGQDRALPAGTRVPAARRPEAGARSTCAWSPPPTATCRRWPRRGSSAPSCCGGSTSCSCACRRCANAARTCRCCSNQVLRRLASRHGEAVRTLAPEAIGALTAYDWPGNVRELENVRRTYGGDGRRTPGARGRRPADRGARAGRGERQRADATYEAARARFDRLYFTNLLMQSGGSITEAAQRAGLSRGHLHRRLRDLGCDATAARQAQKSEVEPDTDPDRN
jgi:AraC-like DNA-binding protein